MKISDFFLKIVENTSAIQNENGLFLPGHNGPYFDQETTIRNSCHWLMVFSKCYELTNKSKFKDKVFKIAEFLCSDDARPYGYSFYHRNEKGKDSCNGLIGQAWTFEALTMATKILENDKYSLLAGEVFFQHLYNEKHGLWHCLEINGNILSIDGTFNHQLWFASSASLIKCRRNNEILERVRKFINMLPQNLTILENGLIFHHIECLFKERSKNIFFVSNEKGKRIRGYLRALKNVIWHNKAKAKTNIRKDIYKKEMYRSIGYHAFNMYAFAILKSQISNNPIWKSEFFNKAIDYVLTDEYKYLLNNNKYGFPYNPPGFEVPYSLYMLKKMNRKELIEVSKWWINKQFERCYNENTFMMDRNTTDYLTHTARIYELTRLPNSFLEEISINY